MRKIKKYNIGGLTPNGVGVANTDLDFLSQNALANMNAKFGQNMFAGKDYRTFNPSNSLNIDSISSGIGGAADLITNAISSSKQKYDTVKQARMATATNSLTGLAKGAAAGAAVGGPVGAAIGAGVGLWSGLIGGKNKVSDAGFYEDPTLQYGTGIIGAVGRGKAEDKYQELLRKAIGNRNARAVGQELNTDWLLNYDSENNVFAANGGNVSDLAWLDDGEMFKTPDQQIYNVPEQGKPEDSNLLSIPEGTKVLSDKLKVPGTKETFANMAKRLTSNKSKYNDKYAQGAAEANAINDKLVFDTLFDIQEGMKGGKKEYKSNIPAYATGSIVDNDLDPIIITAKRPANVLDEVVVNGINLKDDTKRLNGIPIPDYLQSAYSNLIRLLSSDSKNAIAINSEVDNINRLLSKNNAPKSVRQQWNDVLNQYINTLGVGALTVQQQMIPDSMQLHIPGTIQSPVTEAVVNSIRSNARINTMVPEYTDINKIGKQYTPVGAVWNTGEQSLRFDNPGVYVPNSRRSKSGSAVKFTHMKSPGEKTDWQFDDNALDANQLFRTVLPEIEVTAKRRQPATVTQYSRPTSTLQSTSRRTTPRFTLTPQQIQVQDAGLDMLPNPVDIHNIAVQELSTPIQTTQSTTPVSTTPVSTTPVSTPETRSPYDWAQLATDVTSLLPVFSNLGERPETFASVHNPYTNTALNTLGRRRYDVRPTINAIRRGMASNNYAMSQNNTNTGANLAFRLQNAINTNNAINTAYAQAVEMNNAYAADYADALNNFGQQYVQARNAAIDQNARSRAQARNINRAGLSQLSNYAQTRLRDRNQRLSDAAMMDLYKPLLDVGFTPEQYARMFEQVSRRR